MNTEMATDEVTDGIAHIEMQRQDAQREEGLAVACRDALRKLHELLAQERAAMQTHTPQATRSPNVDAVTTEIERVKRLAGGTPQRGGQRNAPPDQRGGQRNAPPDRHPSPGNAPRNRARNKGRRSAVRNGGR